MEMEKTDKMIENETKKKRNKRYLIFAVKKVLKHGLVGKVATTIFNMEWFYLYNYTLEVLMIFQEILNFLKGSRTGFFFHYTQ